MSGGQDGRREDATAVQKRVTKAGSSFYWAMRLLPANQRDAMFAIYALCRELDDIADGEAQADVKLRRLGEWRDAFAAMPAGGPDTPLVRALSAAIVRHALPAGEFEELIRGMETDAMGDVCAPSMDDLMLYCRRVAGSVGLLSIAVFGRSDAEAQRFALALGDALQITNVLRDIDEDARRGRLYLPEEALKAAGIESREPSSVLGDSRLPVVCGSLSDLAERKYVEAEEALRKGGAKGLRPARTMMAVYRRLLDRLRQRGWEKLDVPTRVPAWERIWIAFRQLIVTSP